jgi:hypothetical protein
MHMPLQLRREATATRRGSHRSALGASRVALDEIWVQISVVIEKWGVAEHLHGHAGVDVHVDQEGAASSASVLHGDPTDVGLGHPPLVKAVEVGSNGRGVSTFAGGPGLSIHGHPHRRLADTGCLTSEPVAGPYRNRVRLVHVVKGRWHPQTERALQSAFCKTSEGFELNASIYANDADAAPSPQRLFDKPAQSAYGTYAVVGANWSVMVAARGRGILPEVQAAIGGRLVEIPPRG